MKENQNTCGECGTPAIGLCSPCERRLSAEADYYANAETPTESENDGVCQRCGGEGGEDLDDGWMPCYHCRETGQCDCEECHPTHPGWNEWEALYGVREDGRSFDLWMD